jgi:hypothetical protein
MFVNTNKKGNPMFREKMRASDTTIFQITIFMLLFCGIAVATFFVLEKSLKIPHWVVLIPMSMMSVPAFIMAISERNKKPSRFMFGKEYDIGNVGEKEPFFLTFTESEINRRFSEYTIRLSPGTVPPTGFSAKFEVDSGNYEPVVLEWASKVGFEVKQILVMEGFLFIKCYLIKPIGGNYVASATQQQTMVKQ